MCRETGSCMRTVSTWPYFFSLAEGQGYKYLAAFWAIPCTASFHAHIYSLSSTVTSKKQTLSDSHPLSAAFTTYQLPSSSRKKFIKVQFLYRLKLPTSAAAPAGSSSSLLEPFPINLENIGMAQIIRIRGCPTDSWITIQWTDETLLSSLFHCSPIHSMILSTTIIIKKRAATMSITPATAESERVSIENSSARFLGGWVKAS